MITYKDAGFFFKCPLLSINHNVKKIALRNIRDWLSSNCLTIDLESTRQNQTYQSQYLKEKESKQAKSTTISQISKLSHFSVSI